jgi:hypothetical protein
VQGGLPIYRRGVHRGERERGESQLTLASYHSHTRGGHTDHGVATKQRKTKRRLYLPHTHIRTCIYLLYLSVSFRFIVPTTTVVHHPLLSVSHMGIIKQSHAHAVVTSVNHESKASITRPPRPWYRTTGRRRNPRPYDTGSASPAGWTGCCSSSS